jgi:hypothetical protein
MKQTLRQKRGRAELVVCLWLLHVVAAACLLLADEKFWRDQKRGGGRKCMEVNFREMGCSRPHIDPSVRRVRQE